MVNSLSEEETETCISLSKLWLYVFSCLNVQLIEKLLQVSGGQDGDTVFKFNSLFDLVPVASLIILSSVLFSPCLG